MNYARKWFTIFAFGLGTVVCGASLLRAEQVTVNFNELAFASGQDYNAASGGFTLQGVSFNNDYANTGWFSWGGWAYSRIQDTTTAGYTNQYAVYDTEHAYDTYLVGYSDDYNGWQPTISLDAGLEFESVRLCNTTYAALSMLNGDGFTQPFDETDWFTLVITGVDSHGAALSQKISLAQWEASQNALDLNPANADSLTGWFDVNLRELGFGGSSIALSFESTDMAVWGMNTPAYVALGEVVVSRETPDTPTVPEPSTWCALLGFASVGMMAARRRMHGNKKHV
ncbi:MAG: DUF4465 domain-containing protein [Thermoguttaceae bacterium]|nr:DUF4465 domain-containing protein [Thermoguttaceae bacterium]